MFTPTQCYYYFCYSRYPQPDFVTAAQLAPNHLEINQNDFLPLYGITYGTPLHWACHLGYRDILEILLFSNR